MITEASLETLMPTPARRAAAFARMLLTRIAMLVVIMFGVVLATFAMVRLVPGDIARVVAGRDATLEQLEHVRDRLGLSGSLPEQLVNYLGGLVRLDLGNSFINNQPVRELLADRLPYTLILVLTALVTVVLGSLFVGISVAALTAGGRRRPLDAAFGAAASLGATLPSYLAGTFLVFVIAVQFNLLPVAGTGDLRYLVLPALAVSIGPMAGLSRVVRAETASVLTSDFILAVRSKRLSNIRILFRHLIPNMLSTSLAIGGIFIASILGGSVVVEAIFAWPGLGTALIQAVLNHDYPVVQGIVVMLALLVVSMNAVIDVAIVAFDPRRRGERR